MNDATFWIILIFLALGWLLQVVAWLFDSRAKHQQLRRRLAAVERQLDLVNERLGIDAPEPFGGVIEHLRQGRKIAAIKEYREEKDVGLAEAKVAVEQLARERGL